MTDRSVVPIRPDLVVGSHERRHIVEAGAIGLVIGWLIGRRHHPYTWIVLAGGLVALVGLVVAFLPYVLAAGALLFGEHLVRRRGWSIKAAVVGVLSLALAFAVVLLVAVAVGAGVAVLVGVGGLVA